MIVSRRNEQGSENEEIGFVDDNSVNNAKFIETIRLDIENGRLRKTEASLYKMPCECAKFEISCLPDFRT